MITPITDWENNDVLTKIDFDRIEKNIEYLRILLG